jgi:hypothetical protein
MGQDQSGWQEQPLGWGLERSAPGVKQCPDAQNSAESPGDFIARAVATVESTVQPCNPLAGLPPPLMSRIIFAELSLLFLAAGETARRRRLFFIVGGLFGGDGLPFLLVGAASFGLFLRVFFLVRLWRSVTHNFLFLPRVHSPAA